MSEITVIKVFHKNQLISVKQFEQEQIVLGKQGDAGLVLRHKDVAQMHCVIEKRGDKYFLCDLGSEMGTEVYGQKILEHELRDGEVFNIADLKLQFFIGVPGSKKTDKGAGLHAVKSTPSEEQDLGESQNQSQKPVTPTSQQSESSQASDSDNIEASNHEQNPPTEGGDSAQETSEGSKQDSHQDTPENAPQNMPQNTESKNQTVDSGNVKPTSQQQTDEPNHEQNIVSPTSVQESEGSLSEQEAERVSDAGMQGHTQPNQRSNSSVGVTGGVKGFTSTASLAEGVDRSLGTFAPAASYIDLDEVIDVNSRGSVVEVALTWKERIISTNHFGQKQKVILGNTPDCDVQLPVLDFRHEFIDINNGAQVFLPGRMDGFLYRGTQRIPFSSLRDNGQLERSGDCYILNLAQGEMARCFLLGDKVQAYVSYVEQTPKAMGVPIFDFTTSEIVAIALSFILSALIAIYMTFTGPERLNELDTLLDDQYRIAVVEFNPPPEVTLPDKVELDVPEKTKPSEEKVVTKVTDKAAKKPVQKKPKKIQKKTKPKKASKGTKGRKKSRKTVKANKKGKPKEVAPNKNKNKKDGRVSNRPGGAVGTGKKGANASSRKKDVSKTGLLGVLSSGGAAKTLDKAYTGAGTTFGVADRATGAGGQVSDRAGEGLGTNLKNIGAGGKGSSTVGISGVGSKGRGGGQTNYGGNGGLGDKGRVAIVNVQGNSGEFVSSIDKEAIKRIIMRNKSAIKSCYDIQLAKKPNLAGKIVLQWSIVNGGRMVKPGIKSSDIPGTSLGKCIISRLRVLKFPDPGPNEIAQVAFPFVFEAR